MSPSADSPCSDCSAFLNWDEEEPGSESEKGVVFRSLVATVKLQPAFDDSLKARAVKLLLYVTPWNPKSVSVLLGSFGRTTTESLTNFVQFVGKLVSFANNAITTAAMKMLDNLLALCLKTDRLTLLKADLIPQLVMNLNPQSLSFDKAVNIHTNLVKIIADSVRLASLDSLTYQGTIDEKELQTVHETILQKVVAPSEQYIRHLCMNYFSIIDGDISDQFMTLLARIVRASPYYPPTMDIIVNMPIVLTIPSCLAFFETERSIWNFLFEIIDSQRKWNATRGTMRQMGKRVPRMLRMEGVEDVLEEKLLNDRSQPFGKTIVIQWIALSNLQGMNLQRQS
ncbi:hypothetical protein BLNAU_5103 [Blattamonas nauphoetae]|uniref:Uncharacterized protein n=1 Tax=Blattamonas nauphoetae TaxID=2049346 RepID=A0ABQ9Y817_9EUKA|nr:hypothetical protein BLNAU_5103 [Blattamonas nauphoetae]